MSNGKSLRKRTPDAETRFIELRAAGRTYADIASALGVSRQTLLTWAKTLRVELHNARENRRDELLRQMELSSEERLKSFGGRLRDLLAELGKRDLCEVSTPALLAMALKLDEHLGRELADPVFQETVEWGDIAMEAGERGFPG